MSRDIRRIREVLGPHDPVRGAELRDAGRGERAQALLAAILAEPAEAGPGPANGRDDSDSDPTEQAPPWPRPPHRAPSRPLRLGLAGAVVLVAVTALVLGLPARPGGPGPVHAATPALLRYAGETDPKPAAPLLLELAAAAGRQPTPYSGGRYRYRRVEGWFLRVDQAGSPPPVEVRPVVVEDWRAADGSGRVVEWQAPAVPGAPGPPRGATPISDVRLPADPGTAAAGELPGDPARLAAALRGRVDDEVPEAAATFVAVKDLLEERSAGPELLASLWRALAATDGVLDRGTVTDRAGRRGVAVSLESGHTGIQTSHRLIIDPETGQLLATEAIVTGDTRALRIKPPAVVEYRLYLERGSVDSVERRP